LKAWIVWTIISGVVMLAGYGAWSSHRDEEAFRQKCYDEANYYGRRSMELTYHLREMQLDAYERKRGHMARLRMEASYSGPGWNLPFDVPQLTEHYKCVGCE
jgi:hypothetical protein